MHIAPFREDGTTYGTPTWIWSVVVDHDLYVRAYNGTSSRVGVGKVVDSNEVGQMGLVGYRNALAGSNTGGIKETRIWSTTAR